MSEFKPGETVIVSASSSLRPGKVGARPDDDCPSGLAVITAVHTEEGLIEVQPSKPAPPGGKGLLRQPTVPRPGVGRYLVEAHRVTPADDVDTRYVAGVSMVNADPEPEEPRISGQAMLDAIENLMQAVEVIQRNFVPRGTAPRHLKRGFEYLDKARALLTPKE